MTIPFFWTFEQWGRTKMRTIRKSYENLAKHVMARFGMLP